MSIRQKMVVPLASVVSALASISASSGHLDGLRRWLKRVSSVESLSTPGERALTRRALPIAPSAITRSEQKSDEMPVAMEPPETVDLTWGEICPVCQGGDVMLLPGGLMFPGCPACVDGLVPHNCSPSE
jgi:hypothetical protein